MLNFYGMEVMQEVYFAARVKLENRRRDTEFK